VERDAHYNSWMHAQADLENYRKRAQREAEEIRRYHTTALLQDLLPGLDNLQRAISAAENSSNIEELLQGVRMVAEQFETILSKNSLKPIEAAGKPFDPNKHEAVQQIPSAEHPPMTVIGASCDCTAETVAGLYEKIEAPLVKTKMETAELVKYSCNAWHAVKVCFANEIGNISKELNVDGQEVMDIFCQDDKLNLSRYYMRPGFAFGGSCLPKDVRALTYQARSLDVDTPLLNSVMGSNERQIERAFNMVTSRKSRKLGVLGISFKAGTDDLRESPIVELVERLLGKGYDIRIFDRNVRMAGLVGANRDYINEKIPHLMQILVARLALRVNLHPLIDGDHDRHKHSDDSPNDDDVLFGDVLRLGWTRTLGRIRIVA
jgi:hypothetical protein